MSDNDIESQQIEIETLKMCQHPNIVRMLDVFENADYFFIVLENLKGGELHDYIEVRQFKLPENQVKEIMRQIASAISYLHSYGIAHRDMKLGNVMMTSTFNDAKAKIVDFGFAKMLGPEEKLHDILGSIGFMAPELLNGEQYSHKCDVFSLGVMMYAIFTASLPFDGNSEEEIIESTLHKPPTFEKPVFKTLAPEAVELLTKMLEKNPSKRPSASEILQSKWMKI
jgi:serine/threonine protein kinase